MGVSAASRALGVLSRLLPVPTFTSAASPNTRRFTACWGSTGRYRRAAEYARTHEGFEPASIDYYLDSANKLDPPSEIETH